MPEKRVNHYEDLQAMNQGKEGEQPRDELHPLNILLDTCSWNNIPLPVKELFELLVVHVCQNQRDFWERKAIQNERMFKLQHMVQQLHARVRQVEEKDKNAMKVQQIETRHNIDGLEQKMMIKLDQLKGIID